jgi:TonB family protein
MLPAIVLFLALFAPQTTTPAALGPNPNAAGVYHHGEGVTPPKLIHHVAPKFSKEARKAKLSGVTVVTLIVDTQGNPTMVHTLDSMADTVDEKFRDAALSLDENAIETVQQYRFSPATVQGNPVPFELNVGVRYTTF